MAIDFAAGADEHRRNVAESFPKRGFIWLLVAVGVFVAGFFLEEPLVLRGTSLPFWPFVLGVAGIILLIDVVRHRRRGDSGDPQA